ncbi:HNH endonuclease [Brevundimonas sp. SPF441]|uniref:HNH endonuclease n=1 Tax=Brevundimonas sp. SPF441 TaxID=2663795 RepID=UPI00129D6954|nr:HNH endonuclease [Brevundimonas sp. SPF441]MRL70016.1 HNH endonuclease [Brevundimonas sp. SPF441]
MWRADPGRIASAVSARFGVAFAGAPRPPAAGYPGVELRPLDVHGNEGFSIVLEVAWRSIELSFRPGPFAGPLIGQMGGAGPEARLAFRRLADDIRSRGGVVTLVVNGDVQTAGDDASWPETWRQLDLRVRRSPAVVNTEDHPDNDAEVEAWAVRFTGLLLSLVPVERLDDAATSVPEGLPEGASVRVEVNRYERSRTNRANCLALHGCQCKACDLDLGDKYGPAGEGFIHVHHVVPVSKLGAGYIVDPLTDLVPLCPNCHGIAHRTDPPASVAAIRAMLAAAAATSGNTVRTGQAGKG